MPMIIKTKFSCGDKVYAIDKKMRKDINGVDIYWDFNIYLLEIESIKFYGAKFYYYECPAKKLKVISHEFNSLKMRKKNLQFGESELFRTEEQTNNYIYNFKNPLK